MYYHTGYFVKSTQEYTRERRKCPSPSSQRSPWGLTPLPSGYTNVVSSRFPRAVCTSKEGLGQELKMWLWGGTLSFCNLVKLPKLESQVRPVGLKAVHKLCSVQQWTHIIKSRVWKSDKLLETKNKVKRFKERGEGGRRRLMFNCMARVALIKTEIFEQWLDGGERTSHADNWNLKIAWMLSIIKNYWIISFCNLTSTSVVWEGL